MNDKWIIQICFNGSAMWLESSTEPKVNSYDGDEWLENITTDDLFNIAWAKVVGFRVMKKKAPKWTDGEESAQPLQSIAWHDVLSKPKLWGEVAQVIQSTGLEKKAANQAIRDALKAGVIESKGKYPSVILSLVSSDQSEDF